MANTHYRNPLAEQLKGAVRIYNRKMSIVFSKTDGEFGALSNMARGYPVVVNETSIPSVEALYQACRFPDQPELQAQIVDAPNAWLAKKVARQEVRSSRADWDAVRLQIMRWCLRLKLGHSMDNFGSLLERTGENPIVEYSTRDTFWGAAPQPNGNLVGTNALGRLLMELRRNLRSNGAMSLSIVQPPPIEKLRYLGNPVRESHCVENGIPWQPSLFDSDHSR